MRRHTVFTPIQLKTLAEYANIYKHHPGLYSNLDIFFRSCPRTTVTILSLQDIASNNPQVRQYAYDGYNRYSPWPSDHDYTNVWMKRSWKNTFSKKIYCYCKALRGIFFLVFCGCKEEIPSLHETYVDAIAEHAMAVYTIDCPSTDVKEAK
jgi:hypothetical protein